MKKIILLMGVAAIAFSSCNKDSVKEINNGHAIDFRVAAETRATETTTANLSSFYVTALDKNNANYFTDVAYTKVDGYFHSSPAYYWPGDGSDLRFYAYAPSATQLGVEASVTGAGQTLLGFFPAPNIEDQKDFVATIASGNKTDNEASGVALTFDHQLTQVEIKAKNANSGYVYTVAGVKIANVVSKADFDFAQLGTNNSPWTLDESMTASYAVEYNEGRVLDSYAKNLMAADGDNAMLLPQQLAAWNPDDATSTGAYLAVFAKIFTADGAEVFPKNGNEYGWLAVPVDTKWEAGYKYVYTLDFSNGAGYLEPGVSGSGTVLGGNIKFTTDVIPWDEGATMEATTHAMVGTWSTYRIERTDEYSDGRIEKVNYETIEEVHEHLLEIYWTVEILSETEYVVYENGNKKTCGYQIVDNYLYVDAFKDENGHQSTIIFIRDINETQLTWVEIYEYNGVKTTNIYYAKRVA